MLQMEIETPPEGASTALDMVALRRQIDVLELTQLFPIHGEVPPKAGMGPGLPRGPD